MQSNLAIAMRHRMYQFNVAESWSSSFSLSLGDCDWNTLTRELQHKLKLELQRSAVPTLTTYRRMASAL